MNQFDVIYGIFQPQRADNLREGSYDFIGIHAKWMAVWIIEDGPYKDQWALQPLVDTWLTRPPFAWVPEEDVTVLKVLESSEGMASGKAIRFGRYAFSSINKLDDDLWNAGWRVKVLKVWFVRVLQYKRTDATL